MSENLLEDFKQNLEKVFSQLREDLALIRTGRASPALVEHIKVSAYGERLELREVATIRNVGPKELTIDPWDKNLLEDIEAALIKADLGSSPITKGGLVHLSLPGLTEEQGEKLTRQVGKRMEEARIEARKAREEARDRAEKLEETQGEDQVFRLKEEIQKIFEKFDQKIKRAGEEKKREIQG